MSTDNPNPETYLNLLLTRYQAYTDHRTLMLEREVTTLRQQLSSPILPTNPSLSISSSSSSAADNHPAAAASHAVTASLDPRRPRYSERMPSVNRSVSASSSRSARGRRERKVKVRYGVDPVLLVPCFMVSGRSARAVGMSEADVIAINFMLALEAVCTDHFRREHFYCTHRPPSSESGHLFMASALCLSTAPPSVFTKLEDLARTAATTDYLRRHGPISWEGRGLTMKALRGLANTLNGSKTSGTRDELELTPVQAWFEVERVVVMRGGGRVDGGLVDAIKFRLRGLVRCAYYGAVIRRQDFNDVVADALQGR